MTKKKPTRSPTFAAIAASAKITPHETDTWDIAYFRRHEDDDPDQQTPGRDYLKACPAAAFMRAVVVEVAASPPERFSGGGYWEAMHGDMTGYFEVRKKVGDLHHRLFCRLDSESRDAVGNKTKPLLVILCGMSKPDRTTFSEADYAWVRELGEEYLSRNEPRSIA